MLNLVVNAIDATRGIQERTRPGAGRGRGCALRGARVGAPTAILDLSLLRHETFRAALYGGLLFRIGIGALPFLLPMLLQLGFGMKAFGSGLLTFASGAGALAMRLLASRILDRFGFRRVLVVTALAGGFSMAACAVFTASTPKTVILAVLLAGGLFRSLHFTGINSIAYADVDEERMGAATSFASAAQHLSLSLGMGAASLLLHLSDGDLTHGLRAADFAPAFVVVGATSAASALIHARLSPAAGASLRHAPRDRRKAVRRSRADAAAHEA